MSCAPQDGHDNEGSGIRHPLRGLVGDRHGGQVATGEGIASAGCTGPMDAYRVGDSSAPVD